MFPRVSLLACLFICASFHIVTFFPSDLRPQLQKHFLKQTGVKKIHRLPWKSFWKLRALIAQIEGINVVICVFTENLQIAEQLLTLLLSSSPEYSALLISSCYFTASVFWNTTIWGLWVEVVFSSLFEKSHVKLGHLLHLASATLGLYLKKNQILIKARLEIVLASTVWFYFFLWLLCFFTPPCV